MLDEIGQPVTVLQGYISMLADGTLRSLNGHAELLQGECERLRGITRKLVQVIREQA